MAEPNEILGVNPGMSAGNDRLVGRSYHMAKPIASMPDVFVAPYIAPTGTELAEAKRLSALLRDAGMERPTPRDARSSGFAGSVSDTVSWRSSEPYRTEQSAWMSSQRQGNGHGGNVHERSRVTHDANDFSVAYLPQIGEGPWFDPGHRLLIPPGGKKKEPELPPWMKEKLELTTRASDLLEAYEALTVEVEDAKKDVTTATRMLDLYLTVLGVSNPPTAEQLKGLSKEERDEIESLGKAINDAQAELDILEFMLKMALQRARKVMAEAKEQCDKHAPKEEEKGKDDEEEEEF